MGSIPTRAVFAFSWHGHVPAPGSVVRGQGRPRRCLWRTLASESFGRATAAERSVPRERLDVACAVPADRRDDLPRNHAFGGHALLTAANKKYDDNDEENEPDRAAANVHAIGCDDGDEGGERVHD